MEKKLWFKAKRYGWGWYPCTWEGWAVIAMYVFVLITHTIYLNTHEFSNSDFLMQFFPQTYIMTVFLIIICYTTGEKPGWRWGTPKHKNEEEEMIDVLDEKGNKTSRIEKKSQVHQLGLWHRCTHIAIVDSKNRILLQQRATTKEQDPGLWAGHGGHIDVGESSLDGILRETKEEIGIVLKKSDVVFLGTVKHEQSFKSGTYIENEFVDIYFTRADLIPEKLNLDPVEVSAVRYFDMTELSKNPAICLKKDEQELIGNYLTSQTLLDKTSS